MSDCAALAILLATCSIVLRGGVAFLAETKSDALGTCLLAASAVLSTLMAAGPVMKTVA